MVGSNNKKAASRSSVGTDSRVIRSPPLSNWIGGWAATALRRAWSTRSARAAGRSGSVVVVIASSIVGGTYRWFWTLMTPGWAKATRSAASFSSSVATRPSRITVQSTTRTSTVGRPAWTIAPWTEAVRSRSVARSSVGALVPRAMTAKKATRTATAIQVERFPKASARPARGMRRDRRPRPKAGPKSRFRRSRGSRIVPVTAGHRSSCARRQGRGAVANGGGRNAGRDLLEVCQGGHDGVGEPGQGVRGVPEEEEGGHDDAADP